MASKGVAIFIQHIMLFFFCLPKWRECPQIKAWSTSTETGVPCQFCWSHTKCPSWKKPTNQKCLKGPQILLSSLILVCLLLINHYFDVWGNIHYRNSITVSWRTIPFFPLSVFYDIRVNCEHGIGFLKKIHMVNFSVCLLAYINVFNLTKQFVMNTVKQILKNELLK